MPTVPASNLPYTGVPTAEPQLGGPSRYQTQRATPDDFGAGVGASIIALGREIGHGADVLAENAIRLQEQHNQIAADDATNKYQDTETKLLYGDPNSPGDTGFYGMKGEDAQRAFPLIRDSLLRAREAGRAALQNDRQKLAFDRETRNLQARTLAGVGHHYVSEMTTYKAHVAAAGVEAGMNRAAQALARGAEAEAEAGVGHAMRSFREGAIAAGYSDNSDYMNNGLLKIRGDYVRQKTDELSKKDPAAAQIYFENNIDALPHQEVIQLRNKLDSAAKGQQAQIDAGILPGTTSAQRAGGQGHQTPYGFSRTEGRGFGAHDLSGTGQGHVVPKTERIDYYRKGAIARGLNPDAIVATVNTEGLHVYTGDHGKSFGDFQLYTGGGMGNEAEAAGINIRDPKTWKEQADFALDQMAAHKGDTAWFAGQWHGPARYAPWAVQNFSNPTTAAAENAPRTAAPATGAGGYKAYGDSLAGHLINHAGVGGKAGNGEKAGRGIFEKAPDSTAVAGIGPVAVKEILRNAPDKDIKGQDIVISTGASNVNQPGALNDLNVDTIAEQVYWAKFKGAKSVTLLGVADPFGAGADRNAQLAKVAADNGAAFAGAIPPENWAGDKVHTKRPAGMLEQVKTAQSSPSVKGNIDLDKRPIVNNPDGSISTVRSMSFNEDGKEILIPTVAKNGSRILSSQEAIDQYHKTGEFLGKFNTPQEATAYAEQLHQDQTKKYVRPIANNGPDKLVKPLPKLDFALPEHEDPTDLPDAQVPGMAEGLAAIQKNVPADNVLARQRAVQALRKQLNMDYQNQQRALKLHNEQVKARATLVQDDYLKRMYPGAPNPPSIQEVLTDDRLREHPEVKRTLTSFMERENKTDPAALVSKQNTMLLFSQMDAGRITTEDPFNQAYVGQQVTRTDRDWLVAQFRGQRSAGGETLKNLKTQIITAAKPSILGPLAAGDERLVEPENAMKLYGYIHAVDEKIDEYQKAGKNPVDLFNPKKPDFVGSEEFMKPFSSTLGQKLRAKGQTAPQAPSAPDLTTIPDADLIQQLNSRKIDYGVGIKELERRGYGHRPAAPAPPVR